MNAKTKGTLLGLFVGLLIIGSALLMGAIGEAGYGLGGTGATTAATMTGTLTGAVGAHFTWSTVQKRVFVSNAPTSGATLFCRFNATTAGNTSSNYDFIVEAGGSWSGVNGMRITDLACYSAATGTYGTDFVVKGVD